MAPGPRNAFAAKVSGSSKGKENQLPPATTTATTTVKKCKKLALRRHERSLSSNDERRTGLAGSIGRQGLTIAETLSSKKTSFQVHFDDKNELQVKHQSRARPRCGSTASSKPLASLRVPRNENIQPAAGSEETGARPSRKRLPEDRSRKKENLWPSKIPRYVRFKRMNDSGRRRDVSLSTAASAHSPKTFAVGLCKTPEQQAPVGASKAQPQLFPAKLFWNTEYHAELPMIEREKEEREPRLSTNFLRGDVNAEMRTLIVTFLLCLGMRKKYPSHIIYRAVKLFDVAIDKLRVTTDFIQLTGLASLWIARKTLENYCDIPKATEMISLAKNVYAGWEDHLIDYERKILRVLNFNVTFADVHSLFGYHLINLSYSAHRLSHDRFVFIHRAGHYAIDVTLLDERFCRMSPSLVAITAAELVLGLVVDTEQACAAGRPTEVQPRWLYWRGLLCGAGATVGSRFSYRFQDEEIDRCRVMMLRCILTSRKKDTKFPVVWKKYNRSSFGRIAKHLLELAGMLSFHESVKF